MASHREFGPLAARLLVRGKLRPNQGFKDDPAHPAIYPTGEMPTRPLSGPQAKLFDLIARRFMSTFAGSAVRQNSLAVLQRDLHKFLLRGSMLVEAGWTEFYRPYVSYESRELPPLKVGLDVPVSKIEAREKFTQPPPRFNAASLLRKMEDENIGTKATRADIIETLYKRGYVAGPRMRATPLAKAVTGVLGQYCPLVIDTRFTAELEDLMEQIQEGKTTRKLVLLKGLEDLRRVMLELIGREEELGTRLGDVVGAQRIVDSSFDTPCPLCGSVLRIVRNRKTGKRFVGCSGRWEKNCNFTLPLPQFGTISILSRSCKVCGFQMVQARSRGRRALVSCPRCYASRTGEKRRTMSVVEVPKAS